MGTLEEKNGNRGILARLRRREVWLEISGYHVGDVHAEDKPVAIISGSTVVGNIFAPKVTVSGLLCGAVVANECEIKAGGQVWGDVFTQALKMAEGGRVQGWISSLDDETLTALRSNGRLPDDPLSLDDSSSLDEAIENNLLTNRDDLQLHTLQQLQAETALALAARAELENSFDQRVYEMAGEAAGKMTRLSEQLEATDGKATQLQQELTAVQETAAQQASQIERQRNELSLSRDHIAEQTESLTTLKANLDTLQADHDTLLANKADIDDKLSEARQTIDGQRDRLQSVEEAMKDNLQHSRELSESLVRWQELAEVKEKRVQELEKQFSAVQFKLSENNKQLEVLREQKRQAENEWHLAQADIENLKKQLPASEEEEMAAAAILEAASRRMTRLEETMAALEQERNEQLLWYRVNLESRHVELEQLQAQTAVATTTITNLETQLAAQTAVHDQLEATITDLTTQLETAVAAQNAIDDQLEATIADLTTQLETAVAAQTTLQEKLQQSENQRQATQDDLQYHINAIAQQSQHHAEIQDRLAEREVQLAQARQLITKQQTALKQLREKAEAHIRQLQSRLKQTS